MTFRRNLPTHRKAEHRYPLVTVSDPDSEAAVEIARKAFEKKLNDLAVQGYVLENFHLGTPISAPRLIGVMARLK